MCQPSRRRSCEICKPDRPRKTSDPKSGAGTFQLDYLKAIGSIVAAFNAAIGHPNIKEFWESAHRAKSMAELESVFRSLSAARD